MAGSDAFTLGAIGATAAVTSTGPLLQVFNELGLVLAVFGAGGGMARVLFLDVPWREAPRPVILGGILGFALGVLSPAILKHFFGLDIGPEFGVQALAGGAFVIGYAQERVLSLLSQKPKGDGDGKET